MTDTANTNNTNVAAVLSVCATTSDKLSSLIIKEGQLVFVHDTGRIALDLHGKRTFYNQIIELESEQERLNLSDVANGKYYFVIETAVLWRYFNGWKQLTSSPNEVLFVGTEMPELGQPKTLYVNKTEGNENISIWDEETSKYKVIADKTQTMSPEDVIELFK